MTKTRKSYGINLRRVLIESGGSGSTRPRRQLTRTSAAYGDILPHRDYQGNEAQLEGLVLSR